MSTPVLPKKPYILIEREGGYIGLLRFAFNQIADSEDWQAPVDAMVPWEVANVYVHAVEFMVGPMVSCTHVIQDGQSWGRIKSPGLTALSKIPEVTSYNK